jgi:IS605 OrfB family transposase
MKIVKTVQVQIVDGKEPIISTIRQYVAAMNFASNHARSSGVFSKNRLQTVIYQDLRDIFGLRSQMAVNVLGDVAMQYAGAHFKNRARVNDDGSSRSVQFKSMTMHVNYPRDYGFKGNGMISINTMNGRVIVPYKVGDYQRELLESRDWTIRSAAITYRKRDKKLFLNIAIDKEMDETMINDRNGIVGIDLGMINLAVTTSTRGKTVFHGGGEVKFLRYKYFKARQSLQQQGTRSAKRRLRVISGREKRFVANENHCIAKKIVTDAISSFSKPMIVMEDLTGIRLNPCKSSRGKRELNSWAFFQLQQFVQYKALEHGIPVIYIDPAYTSQACPRCGHVERGNRNKKLHWFKCRTCGYQSNDDRVGSMNIRDRGVAARYIREARGIVNDPNVSGDDAETSSEGLMPNLDASPRL